VRSSRGAKYANVDEYVGALHVKLREPDDVDTKLFADWLEQVRAIELAP
jgi:hypothetical protein